MTTEQQRQLRNIGYGDGRAGRPPSEMHKSNGVYMEAYRRGQEARGQ